MLQESCTVGGVRQKHFLLMLCHSSSAILNPKSSNKYVRFQCLLKQLHSKQLESIRLTDKRERFIVSPNFSTEWLSRKPITCQHGKKAFANGGALRRKLPLLKVKQSKEGRSVVDWVRTNYSYTIYTQSPAPLRCSGNRMNVRHDPNP